MSINSLHSLGIRNTVLVRTYSNDGAIFLVQSREGLGHASAVHLIGIPASSKACEKRTRKMAEGREECSEDGEEEKNQESIGDEVVPMEVILELR